MYPDLVSDNWKLTVYCVLLIRACYLEMYKHSSQKNVCIMKPCWRLWNFKGILRICRRSPKTMNIQSDVHADIPPLSFATMTKGSFAFFHPTVQMQEWLHHPGHIYCWNGELWARPEGQSCPSLSRFTHAWSSVQLSIAPSSESWLHEKKAQIIKLTKKLINKKSTVSTGIKKTDEVHFRSFDKWHGSPWLRTERIVSSEKGKAILSKHERQGQQTRGIMIYMSYLSLRPVSIKLGAKWKRSWIQLWFILCVLLVCSP